MIDTRLTTLITLMEEKSYTNTALKLNFTQPAITHHIKSLEKEYEITLFKDAKNFELTSSGKILLEYARISKIRYEQLCDIIGTAENSVHNKIGVTEMLTPSIINSGLMEDINNALNKFNIFTFPFNIIEEKLLEGELDVALVDSSFDSQIFNSLYLYSNKIVLVVKKDGKFSKQRITRDILLNSTLIMPNSDSVFYKTVRQAIRDKNLRIRDNMILETNNPDLMIKLIEKTDGIGFMYEDVAHEYVKNDKVKIVELLNFKPSQNVYLIYNRLSILHDDAAKLIDNLKRFGE